MAVDAGAAPDDNVLIVPWEDNNSSWVDEDYNKDLEEASAGISHAGGEITDRARIWFERAARRYVLPTITLFAY